MRGAAVVETKVEKVVRDGTRVLSVTILVGKFSLKFGEVEGRIKVITRTNLNGERDPTAFFVPPLEFTAAIRRAAAIFNEERLSAKVSTLPSRRRAKKEVTGQGTLFS